MNNKQNKQNDAGVQSQKPQNGQDRTQNAKDDQRDDDQRGGKTHSC